MLPIYNTERPHADDIVREDDAAPDPLVPSRRYVGSGIMG